MSLNCFIEVERKIHSDLCGEIFHPSFPRKMSPLYGNYSEYMRIVSMNLFSVHSVTPCPRIQNTTVNVVLHRPAFSTNQPLLQSSVHSYFLAPNTWQLSTVMLEKQSESFTLLASAQFVVQALFKLLQFSHHLSN